MTITRPLFRKMGIISSRISVSDVNFPENVRPTTSDYLGRVTAPHLKQKHSPGFFQSVNNVLSDSQCLFAFRQSKTSKLNRGIFRGKGAKNGLIFGVLVLLPIFILKHMSKTKDITRFCALSCYRTKHVLYNKHFRNIFQNIGIRFFCCCCRIHFKRVPLKAHEIYLEYLDTDKMQG